MSCSDINNNQLNSSVDSFVLSEEGFVSQGIVLGSQFKEKENFTDISTDEKCKSIRWEFDNDDTNDDFIDLTYYKGLLVHISILYSKKIKTSQGIQNGDSLEKLLHTYNGYIIKKVRSEGSDSHDDWVYTISKSKGDKKIFQFSLVEKKIHGFYVTTDDFTGWECNED